MTETKANDPSGDLEADHERDEPARVRLNKYLADHGVASRRKCDELIVQGKVSVDGEPATELGTKVDPERQAVEVDGVVLRPETTRKRYYLLNKPRGVVCTNDRFEARTRAIDLVTDRNKGRIYTVGRLDEESTGLILLTNDGEFANQIAHPRHGVPKTYLVKVRGRIEPEAIEAIQVGVRLSEGRTGGAAIRVETRSMDSSLLSVTIREGKNREVRRIFAAVGYRVSRLHRTRIGTLSDRRLKFGAWRPLVREEIDLLLELARDPEKSKRLLRSAGGRPARGDRFRRTETRRGGRFERGHSGDRHRERGHGSSRISERSREHGGGSKAGQPSQERARKRDGDFRRGPRIGFRVDPRPDAGRDHRQAARPHAGAQRRDVRWRSKEKK